jgi:hypothetical protein
VVSGKTKKAGGLWIRWVKVLFILCVALYAAGRKPLWDDYVYGGQRMCIDYLAEGTLYSGQPYCNQAPLVYYYGLAVKSVVGESLMDAGFVLTKLALLAAIYYMMYVIMRRLTDKNLFPTTLLFILIVYFEGAWNIEMLFSTAFFLIGFEIQHHRRFREHVTAAGFFYALAFYFKYSTVYPILLSLALQLHKGLKSGRVKAALETLKLASSIIVLALLFYTLHPSIHYYSMGGHLVDAPTSWHDALGYFLFSLNIHSLALLFLVGAYAYVLLKTKLNEQERLLLLYPIVCIPLVTLSMTRAWGFYHGPRYYALALYPLLIVSLNVLLEKKRSLFVVVFAVVFIYPGFDESGLVGLDRSTYYSREVDEFKQLVFSGLSALPAPEKGLLFESGRQDIDYIEEHGAMEFFARYGWSVGEGDNRFIYSGSAEFIGAEDTFWAPRLRRITNVSRDRHEAQEGLTPSEKEIEEHIIAGRYDVILYTAHSWVVVNRIISDMPNATLSGYCRLYIPDFTHWGTGRPYAVISYQNKSVCPLAAKDMAEHYYEIFDDICGVSQEAADIIWDVNRRNGIQLVRLCNSKAVYQRQDVFQPKPLDIILFLVVTSVVDGLCGWPLAGWLRKSMKGRI